MQYPKRIDQHVTETKTFKMFSNIIPDEWIIREMTERDYGIDCYIEICEKGCLTGKMLSVQLKGEKEIKTHNKDDFTYVADYDIKPSTFAYWFNLPVFVLFVFIDTSKNIVYFENIKKYIRKNYLSFQKEELHIMKINSNHILTKDNVELINILYLFENNRQNLEHMIESFVLNFEQNIELLDDHWCRDSFMALDEENNDDIRIINLYRISKYLSSYFNIQWNVKSLEEMIREGQSMFGKNYLLYEKQVAEFVQQIIPIMDKIIDKIIDLVRKSEGDYWYKENYTLWLLLDKYDIKRKIKNMLKYIR